MASRCRLDVYHPTDLEDFPTVVWFHAGGLTSGSRFIPDALQKQGIGVVAVDYRLSPKVKAPAYIEDAAAAVAWTLNNIARYGGDPEQVYLAGHSAGGYLVNMVGLDKRWLAAHDIDADDLAGLASFSGHTITHFTVRSERGIPGTTAVIDDLAPQYHVRAEAPPMLIVTGDRNLELLGRYEENAYFWRMMKEVGHPAVSIHEGTGLDHGEMPAAGYPLLLKLMKGGIAEIHVSD